LIICVYLDPIYLIVFPKNESFAKRRRMQKFRKLQMYIEAVVEG
jgi:hypothetical protein